ncbi:MAG: DUF1788 domain-containing protein [Candidatus Humimicrobiaceae bacterium]
MSEIIIKPKSIEAKLEKIYKVITSEEFLKGKGLGNEVNYYIFDYPPESELLVRKYLNNILIKKIKNSHQDINLIIIDLYDILIEILESKKVLKPAIDMEKKTGEKGLLKAIKPILKPENFAALIKDKTKDSNLLLLTGVGKIWPLVRSHVILNNLNVVLNNMPVILFFPGIYNKLELQLFSKFKDDNYYRAFVLVDD